MDVSYREVAGYRTRVLSVEGSGPPILLLHGFSDHAAGWRPFMAALEAQGRRAIAVDLPGFGRADDLRPGPMLPQLVEFTAEIIRTVADENGEPVVVGNSLGGATLWVAAQQDRLPIAGLVTIAPAGFGFTLPVRGFRRVCGFLPGILVVPPLPMWALRLALLHVFAVATGAGRELDQGVGRAWVGQFRTRGDLRHTLDLVQRILVEIDDVGGLPTPTYPLLMAWGSRDLLVRTSREFPGVENVVMKGRGHCPQLQDAGSVAELVLEFAARLPEAAQSDSESA